MLVYKFFVRTFFRESSDTSKNFWANGWLEVCTNTSKTRLYMKTKAFVYGVLLRIARAIFWVPPPQKIIKNRFAWGMGSDTDFRHMFVIICRGRRPRRPVTGDNHSSVGRGACSRRFVRECYHCANVSRDAEDVVPYRLWINTDFSTILYLFSAHEFFGSTFFEKKVDASPRGLISYSSFSS